MQDCWFNQRLLALGVILARAAREPFRSELKFTITSNRFALGLMFAFNANMFSKGLLGLLENVLVRMGARDDLARGRSSFNIARSAGPGLLAMETVKLARSRFSIV